MNQFHEQQFKSRQAISLEKEIKEEMKNLPPKEAKRLLLEATDYLLTKYKGKDFPLIESHKENIYETQKIEE